jgi:hypothetical protein
MPVFSGTTQDIFQKNLVKPQSEVTYKGDVTMIVEIKLSPGLREVKTYGDLSKIFTDLLTVM